MSRSYKWCLPVIFSYSNVSCSYKDLVQPIACGSWVRYAVWFSAGSEYFYCLQNVCTGSRAHPVSSPEDTGCSFPGDKSAGAWRWPIYLHVVPRLSSGVISPLHHTPLCGTHGQVYFTFINFSPVTHAVWPIHLLIGWRVRLWRSSLCNFFFQPLVNCSFSGPTVVVFLFSDALCSVFTLRGKVLHS
jgi:hypothetical protein